MTEKSDLLTRIFAFCAAAGISGSAFGVLVVKNHKLVTRIQSGKCTMRTLDRIEEFLERVDPEAVSLGSPSECLSPLDQNMTRRGAGVS